MCPFSRVKLDLNFLALEMTIQLLPGEAVPGSKSVRQNGGNSRLLGLLVPVPQTASLPLYSRSNRISADTSPQEGGHLCQEWNRLSRWPIEISSSHITEEENKVPAS